jgi:hypothetical protein
MQGSKLKSIAARASFGLASLFTASELDKLIVLQITILDFSNAN